MLPGRFVIDTHVHAQRHAFKFKSRGIDPDYGKLAVGMSKDPEVVVYDNSPRLLYDMDRYGVNMSVIMTAFGMTDPIDQEIVEKHPDRFVSCLGLTEYRSKVLKGEADGSIDAVCKEIDKELATGKYPGGLRENLPFVFGPDGFNMSNEERIENTFRIIQVAAKYKVPVSGPHGGSLSGYYGAQRVDGANLSTEDLKKAARMAANMKNDIGMWGNIASTFPDVPIIMEHGGMQGWWSEMDIDPTFRVAATHSNVYLECGMWWSELYDHALRDVNIGCEQLIWGTDWGASIPQQWWPGGYPEVYPDQNRHLGPPAHQPDCYGWQYRELMKLNIPQDDMNLILGGNAVRIMKLEDKMPHTRMFKQYLKS